MAQTGERRSFPVWLVSAVLIVVVLVAGMTAALLDPEWHVDSLDMAQYPPGAKVAVVGAEVLAVQVGRKEMGPGWFAVGSYAYRAQFAGGGEFVSEPGALVIVDRVDVLVRCDAAARTCSTTPPAQGSPAASLSTTSPSSTSP
jgi:hypothetical protein